MSDLHDDYCIDAPASPTRQTAIIKDRRRPGRIHDASPALIPLLRSQAPVAIVDDIVPIPGATEVGRGRRRSFWVSLGVGIITAAAVWIVTGYGSSIALAAGKVLRFLYGIGLLL